MHGLEPWNPEGADLQSAAVAAVPHPHSFFKHLMGVGPSSEENNMPRGISCQQILFVIHGAGRIYSQFVHDYLHLRGREALPC